MIKILIDILGIIGAILLLWGGAHYLVASAERIAVRFGVSDLVIGLTVVAFGTSAPELAVSVNAALHNASDMSVGNVVGSNIFNVGFILGLVAMISPIITERKIVYRDGGFLVAVSLLMLAFFYDGTLSMIEGIIFVGLILSYLSYLFIRKEPVDEEIEHKPAKVLDFIILPVSIAVIVGGGNLLVVSASDFARIMGMPEWLIAITIVAAGTSAPELVTSLVAVMKGSHGISAGNLVGSNLFNILGILGITSIISPLTISPQALQSTALMICLTILVLIFLRSKWIVSRVEGALLVLAGLAIWIVDFMGISFLPF